MMQLPPDSRRGLLPVLAASLFSALMLAIAMPGRFGWYPLLLIALVPLLHCITASRPGRSFWVGWLTGFLYHICLLYWIVIVLGRYGGLPLWLAVVVMLLLAMYMGLYLGLFSGILSRMVATKEKVPFAMLAFAPLLWVGLDWLRGILFSGFPWMDLGYGLYKQPMLIQFADLGGHHLVTFCIVLVNTLIVYFMQRNRHRVRQTGRGTGLALLACLVLATLCIYSVLRYQQLDRIIGESDRETVAVVQGNIPQDEKWTPARKHSTLEIYQQLSRQGIQNGRANLIVWPETALPFYPGNDPLFAMVTGFARDQDVRLLTGTPYFTLNSRASITEKALQYYNSALLISPEGEVTGRYSKQHLVPFGEYVPLSRYLPFLEPLVVHVGDFSPGTSVEPLRYGKIKAGILICFESIFSELARKQVAAGANLLVNLTNDAWYGRSSAPHQSFAMSVFRSVETHRSLLRAANTGISGFVDPVGRVMQASPLFKPMVLTENVPIVEEQSVFTRFGFVFGPACLVLACFLFVLPKKKRFH